MSTSVEESGWIKCTDRMPTYADGKHADNVVLCWFTGKGPQRHGSGQIPSRGAYPVSSFNVEGWVGNEHEGVTHWQPMPDAPLGEEPYV